MLDWLAINQYKIFISLS